MAQPIRVLPPDHRARLVLVASPKGGVGKTTLSLNLLVAAAQAGLSVAGLDFDPQRNLEQWQHLRPRGAVATVEVLGADLADWRVAVERFMNRDLIVADTPPGIEAHMAAVRQLAARADLVLVPTGYGPFDLASVTPWLTALERERHRAAVCFNRVNRRARAFRAAQQTLVRVGRLCPVEIPQLEEIMGASARGLSVLDIDRAKGIEDVEAVWAFTRREIAL